MLIPLRGDGFDASHANAECRLQARPAVKPIALERQGGPGIGRSFSSRRENE